ncbi:hypothetical protein X777_15706 [Ooceraea biroi]|uniref:Uncharacterized protein n=1 Tax=Ooceraea biroi TaxID=2015173 RepID=A0A026WSN9_OOCBI|nr:hypothetical protein X777_15706 [Ooceraea biroi]
MICSTRETDHRRGRREKNEKRVTVPLNVEEATTVRFQSADKASSSSSLLHRSGISLRSTCSSVRVRHAHAKRIRSGKESGHARFVTTCRIASTMPLISLTALTRNFGLRYTLPLLEFTIYNFSVEKVKRERVRGERERERESKKEEHDRS